MMVVMKWHNELCHCTDDVKVVSGTVFSFAFNFFMSYVTYFKYHSIAWLTIPSGTIGVGPDFLEKARPPGTNFL